MQLSRRATNYQMMQDGASVHKANSTTRWLADNHVRVFNNNIWPPNSPDMNPIEHIWPMVGRLLSGRVSSGRDDLWDALVVPDHPRPSERAV